MLGFVGAGGLRPMATRFGNIQYSFINSWRTHVAHLAFSTYIEFQFYCWCFWRQLFRHLIATAFFNIDLIASGTKGGFCEVSFLAI